MPQRDAASHRRAFSSIMVDYIAKAKLYLVKSNQTRELAQKVLDQHRRAALLELAEIYDQLSRKFLERAAEF